MLPVASDRRQLGRSRAPSSPPLNSRITPRLRAGALALVIVGQLLLPVAAQTPCKCELRDQLVELENSPIIVFGRISRASLADNGEVDLSLAVHTTLRGVPRRYRPLRMAAPEACGAPVHLGADGVYFFPETIAPITACQRLGVHWSEVPFVLDAAPLLRANGAPDDAVHQRLVRLWWGMSAAELQGFFRLVNRLDQGRSVQWHEEGRRLEYGQLHVRFDDAGRYAQSWVAP